ncbi:MAG: biotin synthase BioB [Candidatus Omnitrophota bacterium]
MRKVIVNLANKIISGGALEYKEAKELLSQAKEDLSGLLEQANRIRSCFRGNRVHFCSITNAKSGACNQDCKFCAQSAHHNSNVSSYPLINPDLMLPKAKIAFENKAERFCLVTSGPNLTDKEIDLICAGIRLIKNSFPGLKLDASLGAISKKNAKKLKKAGLTRYNHNLETSEKFFPKICTTHTFKQRFLTVKLLKEVGLEVCSGGIFGLGESDIDRLNLGFSLRDLDVDCIPINLLNPLKGTPLENKKKISYEEAFKMIAIFRFIHPQKEIKICGGRQAVLKDKQSKIFFAGADSIILGDYLTTEGSAPTDDIAMIKRLGLEV